jgi:DNA-directed RNA polymerase subunit RPC12/RpoP
MKTKNRRHKCCKCSRWFYWESHGWGTSSADVKCPHCGETYEVEIEEVPDIWLSRKDRRSA